MKRKINNKYLITVLMLVFSGSAIFWGCKDFSDLGMELLPSTDLINVSSKVIKDDISAFTHAEDSVQTDEASKNLLGSINDPVFGNTTIDLAAQFRLVSFPDYGANPEADSIKLYLYYRFLYGDTVTTQKIRVYELESSLDVDATYYHDTDLKQMASNYPLAEYEFTPKVELDSTTKDTLYQLLEIPLDIMLAEKLMGADSTDVANNDAFLQFFKGLYFESEQLTEDGGTILTLEAASNSSFQGSALAVFYNNDSNKVKTDPDTLLMPYVISEFSARVNRFTHDYSGTPFEANLNSVTSQDSLIYIQATGGLQSKIFIDNLSNWKDSVTLRGPDTISYGINKAELVFQIDTTLSDVKKFPPPEQLLFTVIDSVGGEYLPVDYVFSPDFYGGGLNSDYTYRFNITQHLQQIIDGEVANKGFYLTSAWKNSEANRVVLKGSGSKTGIRLIITYSKFL